MLYSEILNLAVEDSGGRANIRLLRKLIPNVPKDVFEQFFYDHGRNSQFQLQYGNLDISTIIWKENIISAKELLDLNIYSSFSDWVKEVEKRTLKCTSNDFSMIDTRIKVSNYWKNNKTWLRSPILLSGTIMNLNKNYHLVEGHTRISILKGLISNGIISVDSKHRIWIGYKK